jgi:signal transduction histidine kinase
LKIRYRLQKQMSDIVQSPIGMESEDVVRMNRVLRHRLRNFISGIKTSISLVSQEVEGLVSPDIAEYFPLILKECSLVEELTQRMSLAFDNVQVGGPATSGQVLEKMLVDVKAHFPSADIHVDVDEAVSHLRINGDVAVSSVLSEIVKNAIESSGRDKVVVEVVAAENVVKFVVVDRGKGVPEEDLSKIFLPFYTTKSKHLGLGLAIVKRLLSLIGGKVTVVSGGRKGFAFEVVVPVQA